MIAAAASTAMSSGYLLNEHGSCRDARASDLRKMQHHRQKGFSQGKQDNEQEVNQETPSGPKLVFIPKNGFRAADGAFGRPDRGVAAPGFRDFVRAS